MAKVSTGDSPGTSRHIRNITFSVAGTAIPLAAGIVALPMLLSGLGTEKLGLFTLALGLFGFTGLFDLGLGRALTRTVAHELSEGRSRLEVAGLMRRGLEAIGVLGCLWGIGIWLAAPYLADSLHLEDSNLHDEVVQCVRVLAALIPLALVASGFNGALEGDRAFRAVNLIRAPMGVATYLAPALVALQSHSLLAAVTTLAVVRLAGLVALFATLARAFPGFWSAPSMAAGSLWRYSGWLTISNIVGPLMTTGDRYYLATAIPPATIAPYTVVFDTIHRLMAFPFAAIAAVFPSLTNPGNTTSELKQILDLAGRAGLVFWAAPLLLGSMFAHELLSAWMGREFANASADVAIWIIAGILMNGFSLIPFMVLQADDRILTTIKFHLLEFLPYALLLVVLVKAFGIAGAGMAWVSRVALDAILLFGAARRQYPPARAQFDRLFGCALVGTGMVFVVSFLPITLRAALAVILVAVSIRFGSKVFKEARRG